MTAPRAMPVTRPSGSAPTSTECTCRSTAPGRRNDASAATRARPAKWANSPAPTKKEKGLGMAARGLRGRDGDQKWRVGLDLRNFLDQKCYLADLQDIAMPQAPLTRLQVRA